MEKIIDVNNQWKRSRDDFFERIRLAAERANLTPDESDRLAAEAVMAVRDDQSAQGQCR